MKIYDENYLSHIQKSLSLQPLSRSIGTILEPALTTMAEVNLEDLQGDLFSRGFPKFHEVYYFFNIPSGKEKEFAQKVKILVSGEDRHISSLKKVLEDWTKVDAAAVKNRENRAAKNNAPLEIVPTVNALIAFSKSGLDQVRVQPSC